MKNNITIIFFLSLCLLGSLTGLTQADGLQSYAELAQIPVLDNGRIKPLDTYARNLLIQFSGRDTYEGRSGVAWLAALLFTPEAVKDDKVLLINNPDIAIALALEPVQNRRYSYQQIEQAFPKLLELAKSVNNITEKERSVSENEVLRVFENVSLYKQLSQDFLFALPQKDFTLDAPGAAQILNLPEAQKQFCFVDIAMHAREIHVFVRGLAQTPPDQWTPAQRQMVRMIPKLYSWSSRYRNMALGLIPPSYNESVWISPWDAIADNFKSGTTRHLVLLWRAMAVAYTQGQQGNFDKAAQAYLEVLKSRLSPSEIKTIRKFPLELAYYRYHPFLFAKIFYILALFFFVVSFMSTNRCWYLLAWGAVIAGFVPHLAALMTRIIIMGRPPVSSLYETFIFVSLIAVFLGIWIEWLNKRWLGIVVAGVGGTVLLFIASKYSAEGDTLKMLIAVLNSNFWLSTHVTSITMGYASTCVAGILGHIWLIQALFKKPQEVLNNTYNVMMGILALALTLTFLGTNLGGIWADQSWGRFWGWDPKENGALMIVLWNITLFHARIGKMLGPMGMAVGTVLGMIVVMWAWFGVNLLSIGLHSYGFTSGVANALMMYVIGEVIFLVVIIPVIKFRQ